MKQFIVTILLPIIFSSLNVYSQNNEFRFYKGEKNKYSSTEKSNLAFNKGNEYFDLGDYENAVKQYSISIEEDKKQKYLSTDTYLNRAKALTQLNLFNDAIEDYSVVIENETDETYMINAYIGRGGIYGFTNDFDKGIFDFEAVLKKKSKDVDALYNLSRLYIQRKEFNKGLDLLEKAEKEYHLQGLNIPISISSILYMKGIAKYSLGNKDYCKEFLLAMNFKYSMVEDQINFIKQVCY